MKVKQALERLARILPLKSRLDDLDRCTAKIYFAVLNGFYQQGRAPTIRQLQEIDVNALAMLEHLVELDMLTQQESGEIKGCYPFTMEQRVHQILINGFHVHAMCALDALAPSCMFECYSEIDSVCAVTAAPVHIELDKQRVLNADSAAGVYFGINWMAANSCCSCSDSLCTEMLFLKDLETAQAWLDEDHVNREIFNLEDAIAFSCGFFKPLMQQG